MPTFKYTAKNQDSQNVSGKIVADNQHSVIEELRKRKLIIISVQEIKEAKFSAQFFESKRVKPDEIVIFSRQLATMVDAGIPIIQALDALQLQITLPAFKKVILTIKEDIEHGNSLAVAFAKHTQVFDLLFINMVKVGETGGVLSTMLDRVATYLEKTLRLQRKIISAMIYPAVVISMAIGITTLLLIKVVPTFAGIYTSLNQKLPGMTLLLIAISDFLKHYLLFFIIGTVSLIFVLIRWHQTDRGARVIDRAFLRIPIFGDLLRKVVISRFSRTLATLVQSGVPILESLDIVGKTIGNRIISDVVIDVKNHVREGESIAKPLEKCDVFPTMVTRMIAIGEQSGQLEKMLLKIAEFYDEQVDTAVEALTSIIEPVIIGVLGIVIGFIVIALFLPIINLTRLI